MERFDLVVAGAGPAGISAALEGAARSMRTLVVGEPRRQNRAGEILGPEAITALDRMGVAVEQLPGVRIYSAAMAWRSARLEYRDHLLHPAGLALALEDGGFDRLLLDLLVRERIEFRPGRVAIRRGEPGWICDIVSGADRRAVGGTAVVVATGRGRWPVREVKAPLARIDRLVGIGRLYRLRGDGDGLRHQSLLEASAGGWWFLAPQSGSVAVATFYTDMDLLPRDAAARALLAEAALSYTIHAASFLAEPVGPASIRDASTLFRECTPDAICAAGDALHCYDPLTGFGIAKALEEGRDAIANLRTSQDRDGRRSRITAERAAYLKQRDSFYAEATKRFDSSFWERRRDGNYIWRPA